MQKIIFKFRKMLLNITKKTNKYVEVQIYNFFTKLPMAHKGFQLGLEMPALLGGIATSLTKIITNSLPTLEMPALLGGIATCNKYHFAHHNQRLSHHLLEMPALLGGIATMSCLSYELMP